MNIVRVNPRVYVLDVGTDGGVKHDVYGLGVQPIFEWIELRTVFNEIASLHVLPKEWKECVAQVPTSHGQFAEHSQPFHLLYEGLPEPLLNE